MNSASPIFRKVALIGAGLIGSSIAHAARRAGLASHIAAFVPRDSTRARAAKSGFADSLHAELAPAVTDADLVVLATPLGTFGELSQQAAPHMSPGAILTDVGSVKSAIIRDVGSARTDGSAFHSRPSGRGHRTIRSGSRLCGIVRRPLVHPDAAAGHRSAALENLKQFWRRCGSDVEMMDARAP